MLSTDMAVSADGRRALSGATETIDPSRMLRCRSPGGQPWVPRRPVFLLRGEHRESDARRIRPPYALLQLAGAGHNGRWDVARQDRSHFVPGQESHRPACG